MINTSIELIFKSMVNLRIRKKSEIDKNRNNFLLKYKKKQSILINFYQMNFPLSSHFNVRPLF